MGRRAKDFRMTRLPRVGVGLLSKIQKAIEIDREAFIGLLGG